MQATSPETPSSPLPPIASDLLIPYTVTSPLTSSPKLPPLSRIDPSVVQREAPLTFLTGNLLEWGRRNWWDLGWFLGRKGFDIGWGIVKYGLLGPPKKSWGIEMTVIAAIMRNIGQHSSLADITLVRQLISVHHLLPLPPDAIVTPISFVVKRRKEPLKGFFRELDLQETGERELSGEWVVGKSVWKRLKMERKRRRVDRERGSDRPAERASSSGDNSRLGSKGSPSTGSTRSPPQPHRRSTSSSIPSSSSPAPPDPSRRKSRSEKVIYYVHGGAYYVGQATTHRTITIALSKVCDARVFALNYRLAPENRFPLGLLDVINGYFRLIDSLHILPSNILVVGDSAGGGLCLAMAMYLRDEGYHDRLPRALILLSPWVDLTMSCGSWDENAPYDVVPQPGKDDHLNPVGCYLGPDGINRYITHPYASPLFGDLSGLPPMLIQAGDAEVLRDEITLLAHKATLAGTKVKHELYTDQVHVFQSFPFLEATSVAFKSIGKFVARLRDRPSPRITGSGSKRTSMDVVTSLPASQVDEDARPTSSTHSRSVTPSGMGEDTVGQEIQHGRTRLVKSDGTELDVLAMSDDDAAFDSDAASSESSSRRGGAGGAGGPRTARKPPKSSPLARVDVESDAEPDVADDAEVDRQVDALTTTPSAPTTPVKPFLRRALSSFSKISLTSPSSSSSSSAVQQPPPSSSPPPMPSTDRHHRRRSSAAHFTMSAMPLTSDTTSGRPRSISSAESPSAPGSPKATTSTSSASRPKVTRRPTLSSSLMLSPAKPTTRHRSQSHSDMVSLVEGYGRSGAANRTIVYTPVVNAKSDQQLVLDDDAEDEEGGGEGTRRDSPVVPEEEDDEDEEGASPTVMKMTTTSGLGLNIHV